MLLLDGEALSILHSKAGFVRMYDFAFQIGLHVVSVIQLIARTTRIYAG